ncbi:unnamed protein product [Thelazia callipaeda]|uniref:Uncharacterized protein n=1 Tax=Thelazia callipaeda TaxID=103827 RepID=A0A0N5CN96_THECL|nr:unnamed protein product [Thelazia callipaeda]
MSEGEISNAIDNPGFFDEISPFRSENNNSFTNEQNNISCTVQYTSQNSANNSAQNEIEFVSNIEKCTMSEEEETDTVTGNRSNSSEVEKGICSVYNGNNYDSTVIFVVDNDDNGQVEIESSDNDHASLIPTIEDNIESTEKSQNYDSKSAEVRIDETDIREARENKEGNNNGDNHNGDPGVMIDDCDEIQIFKCEEASSREDNQNNSSSSL